MGFVGNLLNFVFVGFFSDGTNQARNVYMVRVQYLVCLNDPSLIDNWHIKEANPPQKNVGNVCRYVGLVLRYDPVPCVVVVFLGTTHPSHSHRYVPWKGIP